MAPSWKDEKQKQNRTTKKGKKKNCHQSPSSGDQCFSSSHLHIQLEKKIQTRVPSYSAISESLVPCPLWEEEKQWLRQGPEGSPFIAALLSGEGRRPLLGRESQTEPLSGASRPVGFVSDASPTVEGQENTSSGRASQITIVRTENWLHSLWFATAKPYELW